MQSKENNKVGFVLLPFYIPLNTITGWRIICFAVAGTGVASQPRDTIVPSSTQDWGTLQPVFLQFASMRGRSLHAVSLAVVVGSKGCPGLLFQRCSVLWSVGGQDFRHSLEKVVWKGQISGSTSSLFKPLLHWKPFHHYKVSGGIENSSSSKWRGIFKLCIDVIHQCNHTSVHPWKGITTFLAWGKKSVLSYSDSVRVEAVKWRRVGKSVKDEWLAKSRQLAQ